jgi:hypothetical protein
MTEPSPHTPSADPDAEPVDAAAAPSREGGTAGRRSESAAGWVALPVGRADDGPTIHELVEAVKTAGGLVGGDALYDPRYEAEMRRFLIRALEMEGIPVPKGGGRP